MITPEDLTWAFRGVTILLLSLIWFFIKRKIKLDDLKEVDHILSIKTVADESKKSNKELIEAIHALKEAIIVDRAENNVLHVSIGDRLNYIEKNISDLANRVTIHGKQIAAINATLKINSSPDQG